jgi:hypothetical protein
MLNDCLQRHRMERLQEQCTYSPDKHRRIGMDAPDRILLTEPTLAVSPDLGMLRLEVTGNEVPHGFRNRRTRVRECPDHHIAERMRLLGLSRMVPGHG